MDSGGICIDSNADYSRINSPGQYELTKIPGPGPGGLGDPRRVGTLVFVVVLAALIVGLTGSTTGDSDGYIPSGSEGCKCHSRSPDDTVNVSLAMPEGGYQKDVEYNLTINVTGGTYDQGGFYLRISEGSLSSIDENVIVEESGIEATHKEGGQKTLSWTVGWTAPESNTTTFLLFGILVDGDEKTKGDSWNSIAINLSKEGEITITDSMGPGRRGDHDPWSRKEKGSEARRGFSMVLDRQPIADAGVILR
jgi:hypothetical protein